MGIKPFSELTLDELEKLKRKGMAVDSGKSIDYAITDADIEEALAHLSEVYNKCRVQPSFAARMRLRYDIHYCSNGC